MQSHGPCTLRGPITQHREWWQRPRTAARKSTQPMDPGIRTALVARVRREIAAGTYDTPEKFAIALDRMIDRLSDR